MGQIPKRQSRRLASSVVGGFTRDRSSQAFGIVANAAGDVANKAFAIAIQRQKAKDDAYANRSLIEMDLAMEEAKIQHRQDFAEFRGDPADRARAFQDTIRGIFDQNVEGMQSRNAKKQVSLFGERMMRDKVVSEMRDAERNQGVLAFNDTKKSVELIGQEAANLGLNTEMGVENKIVQLNKLIENAKATAQSGSGVLSAENRNKLIEGSPELVISNYMATAVINTPEEALLVLQQENVKEILPVEDHAKFKKAAINGFANAQVNRDIEETIGWLSDTETIVDLLVQGDPTALSQALALGGAGSPVMDGLEKFLLGRKADPVVSEIVSAGLKEDLVAMVKKKRGKADTLKGTLEQAVSMSVKVIDAARARSITRSQMTSLLKLISGPMLKEVKKAQDNKGGFFDVWGPLEKSPAIRGWSAISDWFKNNKINNKEEVGSVMSDYERLLREGTANPLATALHNYQISQNPRLAAIEGKVNKVIPSGGNIQNGVPGNSTTPTVGGVTAGSGVVVRIGTMPDGTRVRDTFENGVRVNREVIEEVPNAT